MLPAYAMHMLSFAPLQAMHTQALWYTQVQPCLLACCKAKLQADKACASLGSWQALCSWSCWLIYVKRAWQQKLLL